MVEAVQTYVRLVNGLTRATRDKARAAAHDLFAQVGLEDVANDAEQRVGKLTEEILSASRANRELLEKLVATEVTKAASRLGFVRFDDLDEVREEIAELRAQLARQQAGTAGTTPTAGKTPAAGKAPTARKTPAQKSSTAGTATATSPAKRSGTRATGAAQRLAAEREASPGPTPAAPRAARARRATSAAAAPAAAAPTAPAPVPDPTADAGA